MRQRARTLPIPAPIGGWNARDATAAMAPTDAVVLDNMYPNFGNISLRAGYEEHATGVGSGSVETVAELNAGTVRKMIAAGGGGIYDASTSGAVGAALASGFTSNRWQHATFNGTLGLVNGMDAPQVYDGTTVSAMTVSGTGLTPADLIGINVFKSRTYFWEKDSQDVWYSDVNVLGGTLTRFPLSRVGTFGGNLIAMATWTKDGGDGLNDEAVFIMSSGDVIVYAGSNPASSADWALVGVFRIGAPVNVRAITGLAGDIVVATVDGYTSLASALPLGRVAARANLTDKIVKAVTQQVQDSGGNFGWHAQFYPRRNMLLMNYPVGGQFQQHVLNLQTGAWCRFTGVPARQFTLYNDELYFGGGDGVVYKGDTGFSDDGANISAEGLTAYSYLGNPAQKKMVQALSVNVVSEGTLPLTVTVQRDFVVRNTGVLPTQLFEAQAASSEWNTAEWNSSEWSGESAATDRWLDRGGEGYAFATRIQYNGVNNSMQWNSQTYLYETLRGI